jgi:hypothetical protein
MVMQANLAAQDPLGVPLAIIAFAMGDTSVGGLM